MSTRPMVRLPAVSAALLVWLASSPSLAQDYPRTEQTDHVDALFERWDRNDSPGAAVGIFQDGKIVYARGYGLANLEYDIPLTPTSVFRVGSVSKQFTAMCIALLAEQGTLSLDADIRQFLPEMPEFEAPVTIRHVLHHTSGYRDYLTLQSLAGRGSGYYYTPDDVLELLSRQKELNFSPGDQHLYSNSGYFLLAEIVARASGMETSEFAKQHIFDPLGMTSTHFHDDRNVIVKNRASGYSPAEADGFRINMTQLEMIGDGAIFTTIQDIFRWHENFFANRLGRGGSGLIDIMLTTGRLTDGEQLSYALGLRLGEHRGLRTIGHGGSFVGFRAANLFLPDQRFSVVVLANLSTIDPMALCRQIVDIYVPHPSPDQGEVGASNVDEAAPGATGDESNFLSLPPDRLRDFAGEYYSEELDVTYVLTVDERTLRYTFKHRRTDPNILTATAPDTFTSRNRRFEFVRDGSGTVSGFRLQAGRVRNLKFDRVRGQGPETGLGR